MRAFPGPAESRPTSRIGVRGEITRRSQHRFLNDSAFLYPPYFYPDDEFDYGSVAPEAPPVQMVVAQAAPPPAPAASPVEPLLLENRGGQWVRIPTGNQMAISQSGKPDIAQAPSLQPGIAIPTETAPPLPELPPAIVVFRDGHMEEVAKYMIQGNILFTNAMSKARLLEADAGDVISRRLALLTGSWESRLTTKLSSTPSDQLPRGFESFLAPKVSTV